MVFISIYHRSLNQRRGSKRARSKIWKSNESRQLELQKGNEKVFIPIFHPSLNQKRGAPSAQTKITFRNNGVITITKALGPSAVNNSIDVEIDHINKMVVVTVGRNLPLMLFPPRYQNASTGKYLVSKIIPTGQVKAVIYLTPCGVNQWEGKLPIAR